MILLSGIVLNIDGFKQVIKSDKFILYRPGTFVGFGYLCNNMFNLILVSRLRLNLFILHHYFLAYLIMIQAMTC